MIDKSTKVVAVAFVSLAAALWILTPEPVFTQNTPAGGGGNAVWSSITNPTAGQSLTMGANKTIWTFTGVNGAFSIFDNSTVATFLNGAQVDIRNSLNSASGHAAITLSKGASTASALITLALTSTPEWDMGIQGDNNFHIRDSVNSSHAVLTLTQGAPANSILVGATGGITLAGVKSVTGSSFVCVDTSGVLTASATACN